MGQIRLYIADELALNREIVLNDSQSHYLSHVMKIKIGDNITCFDNKNGEFLCEIHKINKKNITLKIIKRLKPYVQVPDIWLLFAPVKKDNTDFILQKATELGVRKIIPVLTRYTITERIKKERFQAQVIEAAEQCRRVDIPEIVDAIKFNDIFNTWPQQRTLYYMDETLNSPSIAQVFQEAPSPCAILVGPEGGFSQEELTLLASYPWAKGVCLGKRILRAETAVTAALSCWQALNGDWK